MNASDLKPLYTVTEAAELLRVSRKTVDRLIKRRELPVGRIGRRVLIAGKDIADLFNRHKTRRPPLSIHVPYPRNEYAGGSR